MNMDWMAMLEAQAKGGFKLLGIVFVIIVPLMIIMELAKAAGFFDWLADKILPHTRKIGLEKEALLPLLAGLFVGMSYGGGVLISEARSGLIARKQIFLVACFLALCHSVIEDTLLFMAVGANALYFLTSRLLLAVFCTYLFSLLINRFNFWKLKEYA